jgi:hypothetical protein
MSRKLILLNLALLALAGILVWQARVHYLEMKAHERAVLLRSARAVSVLPPPSAPVPAAVAPVQYIEVAQKTLFSKDRNPTVVVEQPAPKPEPPMPALPFYFGQIRLGDPVIFLAIGNGPQKRFYVGDKVGEFTIVGFDNEKITLGWNDKKIDKKLEDLRAKADQQPAQSAATAQAAPAASSAPQVRSLGGAASADASKPDSVVGSDRGDGFRGCVMNDQTPPGTVVDGYRKVVVRGLMGNSCYWEKVK